MKTGKKLAMLVALVYAIIQHAWAQDPLFSQYYASALYLNPAMAGLEPTPTFSSNYREQWRSIVIPYITSQISLIHPVYAKTGGRELQIGGAGLSFYNDRAGDGNFKTIGLNINAAYNLYFMGNESQYLTFGLQGGLIQKRVDYTNLTWGEQYNPYIGYDASINPGIGVNAGKSYADIGAGLIYSYKGEKNLKNPLTGFAGFSAYHINRPNESFYKTLVARLPVLYKIHGGLNIMASEKIKISPNVLAMMQGNIRLLNAGMYVTYDISGDEKIKTLKPTEFIVGGWYRLKDSFIISTGIASANYTLGFSYDVNNSNLRSSTQGRGAFEISLAVRQVKSNRYKRYHTPRI